MYCVAHGNITGLDTSVSVLKAHIPLLHDLELKNVDSLWSATVQSLIINWSLGFIFFSPHRNAVGIYSEAKSCCLKFVLGLSQGDSGLKERDVFKNAKFSGRKKVHLGCVSLST